MVGSLYAPGDPRRDSGFSLFYMGINIGAVMAPLVCGWLAESATFKSWLVAGGFNPAYSWHWAFGAAGVGMLVGLTIFSRNRAHAAIGRSESIGRASRSRPPLTRRELTRVVAIMILFAFTIMFWAAYEQKGASLNLFARDLVERTLFGWNFPASWLQSLTPFFVIVLAPLFARLWIHLDDRQPTSSRKFALGLFMIGIAMLLLVPASA